jgi:hypothetical protein
VPTGMSIWTFPGDMTDFLRPATDAMTEQEEARGGGERGRAPGERGRDEEERETVSLLREAATLLVDAPFHTPTFISFISFGYPLHRSSGRPHSKFGSEIPSLDGIQHGTIPSICYARAHVSFVRLSTDDLEPVRPRSERRLKANLPKAVQDGDGDSH